jgi:hypothetical protein
MSELSSPPITLAVLALALVPPASPPLGHIECILQIPKTIKVILWYNFVSTLDIEFVMQLFSYSCLGRLGTCI